MKLPFFLFKTPPPPGPQYVSKQLQMWFTALSEDQEKDFFSPKLSCGFKTQGTFCDHLCQFVVVVEGVGRELLQPALQTPSMQQVQRLRRGRKVRQNDEEPREPRADAVTRDPTAHALHTRRVARRRVVRLLEGVVGEAVSLVNTALYHQLAEKLQAWLLPYWWQISYCRNNIIKKSFHI